MELEDCALWLATCADECVRKLVVVGTVEELSTSLATQNLVRDQFETIFFSQ